MKERLKRLVRDARMNPNAFANQAGIAPSNFRKMLSGEQNITDRTLAKISDAFSVNYNWLKDGEGEPYLDGNGEIVDTNGNKNENTLPFFDEEIFTGGYLQGTGDGMMAYNKVDDVKLPLLKVREGDFAVQVHGRSMIDNQHPELSINDGAIVCLRPWRENFIEYGERYAIATRSGFSVKFITPSDKEGFIKCTPANTTENFAPYYINANDVTGLAKVTAIINIQIL